MYSEYEQNIQQMAENHQRPSIRSSFKGKPGKLKKVLRRGVSTFTRIATMGHSQSHSLRSRSSHRLSMKGVNPNAPPLRFHATTHGHNISIENEGYTARRYESFCRGILFSDRPLEIGERVNLRISNLSSRWSGVIRIGFTTCNPDAISPQHLPKYACPDLTSKPGYWAKALSERYVEVNNLLHYYVNAHGDVYFGVNGQDKGIFFGNVDVHSGGPVWAMVDLYGNCTGIELVDVRRDMNNQSRCNSLPRPRSVASQQNEQQLNEERMAVLRSQLNSMTLGRNHTMQQQQPQQHIYQQVPQPLPSHCGSVQQQQPQRVAIPPQPTCQVPALPAVTPTQTLRRPSPRHSPRHIQSLNASPRHHQQPEANNQRVPSIPPLVHNRHIPFRAMNFHFCTGKNVSLGKDGDQTVARRHDEEFSQGYVFTAQPVQPGQRLVVQVLSTEDSYIGSLAFGLTNCNPSSVDTRELPEDSDALLDRPEYWVVSKDVAACPAVGDELSFIVNRDGSVEFAKNNSPPTVFMHIDPSQTLWAFFDLYGHTSAVRLIGATYTPIQIPNNNAEEQLIHSVNMTNLPQAANPNNGNRMAPTHIPNDAIPSGIGECVVCLENPVDSALYSCGHMCMCYKCSMQQWKRPDGGFCPICRSEIRDVIRTFIA